jgi:hypothetical protein
MMPEPRPVMDFATGVVHLVDQTTVEPWNKGTNVARTDCGRQGYVWKQNPWTETNWPARCQRRCRRCNW